MRRHAGLLLARVSHQRSEITGGLSPQFDSHAGIQVPDLQLSLVNGSEHRGPLWGPLDVAHGSPGGGEAQHGVQVVPPPQLDGPIRGAAQEHVRTEGTPCDAVHRTLRDKM